MPDPSRVPLISQRLSDDERALGLRRVELARRRSRGELCQWCAVDKPENCTGEGTRCPVGSEET